MVPAYDLSPTMETEKFVHGRADRPGLKINPKCSCRSDSLRVFFALASTCGGALYVSICPEEIPKRAEPVKDMGKEHIEIRKSEKNKLKIHLNSMLLCTWK